MTTLGLIFETSAVIVPILLMALLVLGLGFPVYDFIRERRRAKAKGKTLPGLRLLGRYYIESPFLAYFLFIVGFLVGLLAFMPLLRQASITPARIGLMAVAIISGGTLMFIAQWMLKR